MSATAQFDLGVVVRFDEDSIDDDVIGTGDGSVDDLRIFSGVMFRF